MNTDTIQIGGTEVEVRRKKIKNLHIGVYPPDGRVRLAVPEATAPDAIRLAVLTRMPWIRRKQAQFAAQDRQSPRRYVSGETHYLFGSPLRLTVREAERATPRISRQGNDRLLLEVPEGSDEATRGKWMRNWYKRQLRRVAAPRVSEWSARLDVAPRSWGIRSMKTKWGSCNPDKGTIWLNAELAKKPEGAIDYVIVHELAHLVSPTHDAIFTAILDREVPTWRLVRKQLNTLPLAAWE